MSPPHTPEMLDSPEESCLQMPGWSCCLAQSVPWLLASFESDPTQLTPTSWVRKGVPSTSDSHSALHFGTTVFMVLPTPMCPSKDSFSIKLKAVCPPPAWLALHPARWFPSFSSLQLEMGLLHPWLLFCFIVFDAMTHVERIVSPKPSVLCRQ